MNMRRKKFFQKVKLDKALREGNWDYGHYFIGQELLGKKAVE